MRWLCVGVLVVCLVGCGGGDGPGRRPDACAVSKAALDEQRSSLVGLRAAYRISVENGWLGTAAKLGVRVRAGELVTEGLLADMYEACGSPNASAI